MVILLLGCTSQDEPRASGTTEPATTTIGVATAIEEPVEETSGLIRIGPAAYELVFSCVDRGAGEILAVGVGTDINGKRVHAFVQAFVGEPYVGVEVGEGEEKVLFEPRLDVPLLFTFHQDILRFETVDFVTDLDVDNATFTPAGMGSLVVNCASFETSLPPG